MFAGPLRRSNSNADLFGVWAGDQVNAQITMQPRLPGVQGYGEMTWRRFIRVPDYREGVRAGRKLRHFFHEAEGINGADANWRQAIPHRIIPKG